MTTDELVCNKERFDRCFTCFDAIFESFFTITKDLFQVLWFLLEI